METCALHSKAEIEAFLRKNVYLHIYSIGDLDDFFRHNTVWYALKNGDDIHALVLLYTVPPVPTHPDYRGNGFAKSATARLCQSLTESVDHIGLNVKADNTAAMSLYEELGFEIVSLYHECMITIDRIPGKG